MIESDDIPCKHSKGRRIVVTYERMRYAKKARRKFERSYEEEHDEYPDCFIVKEFIRNQDSDTDTSQEPDYY